MPPEQAALLDAEAISTPGLPFRTWPGLNHQVRDLTRHYAGRNDRVRNGHVVDDGTQGRPEFDLSRSAAVAALAPVLIAATRL